MSFKCASEKVMMNVIRMSYCNKEDLRFEFLKGISINDALEHECELASMKDALQNVEVNQRKGFLAIEQGTEKMKKNVLAVIHRGIIAQGKHCIASDHGTACLFVNEKEHKSSVILCGQKNGKSERR